MIMRPRTTDVMPTQVLFIHNSMHVHKMEKREKADLIILPRTSFILFHFSSLFF